MTGRADPSRDNADEDGSRYAVIVNKDLNRARVCVPEFRVPPRRLRFVSAQTSRLAAFTDEHTTLAPGQAVLLKLEQ